MRQFEYRGSWWHSPSLLEPMPGPWAGYEIYGMETVAAWRKIIDYHREKGFNLIITQIQPHFKDRVILGWGYHYLLNFDKFPEARTFSADFVRRNQDKVHAILDYAEDAGIKFMLHQYNFMAPKNFVEHHAELHRRWKINGDRMLDDPMDMGNVRAIADRLGVLYGNVCWREPVYREFMLACWDELLQKFPLLHGLLQTPGESQFCLCEACTGLPSARPVRSLFEGRNGRSHETTGDFTHAFNRKMKELKKLGVMRLWYIKGDFPAGKTKADFYPKDLPYMSKYHWFDCVDTGPDPVIKEWIDDGYKMWVSKELWGENAGPVQWHRPDYIEKLVRTCRDLGVSSLVSHQNNDWGTAGIPGFLQRLNIECFANAIRHPESSFNPDTSYRNKFGKAAPVIREAVESYSDFVLNITKLVILGGEGYTFSMIHPVALQQGKIGREVDAWIRGDVGQLADYVKYFGTHPWDENMIGKLFTTGIDPFKMIDRWLTNCDRALELLGDVEKEIPAKAKGELIWIMTSARICRHQAEEYYYACRAAMRYYAWQNPVNDSISETLEKEMLALMESAVAATGKQREDMLDLPTSSIDFSRSMRSMQRYDTLEPWRASQFYFRSMDQLELKRKIKEKGKC